MEVKKEYGKSRVVVLNVGQDDVDGMLINWDLTDDGQYAYMEKEFVNSIMNYLPEYAMGYDVGNISNSNVVEYLRETAKSVIQIKKINEIKQYLESGTPYDKWDQEVLRIYNTKGIFKNTVYALIKEGRISSIKQGKKIIVPKVCLVEFLTNAANFQTPSPTVPNNLWTYEDGCDSVGVAREDKGQFQKKGA